MKIPVSKATQKAIARNVRRSEIEAAARGEVSLPNGWRTDFENAPSPCIGWCTPPAGDDVRQIWRHPTVKDAWSAHGIQQTVKAWQPLPAIPRS